MNIFIKIILNLIYKLNNENELINIFKLNKDILNK